MLYLVDMDKSLTIGQRIASARKTRPEGSVTQAQIASHLGVTPQAVSGWERDEAFPHIDKLMKMADFLGTTLEYLLEGQSEEIVVDAIHAAVLERRKQANPRDTFQAQIVPGNQLTGARDFPIYAAAQGGNGHMIVHTDVMEYVKRPVILEGVPDSYGILIVGDSMVPAYRSGDMALVHPRRPPERDTDVILYQQDHRSGDASSMIKRLVGFNDRQWKLEQYNPAKTFSEHRADWPICHRVVGSYKAR